MHYYKELNFQWLFKVIFHFLCECFHINMFKYSKFLFYNDDTQMGLDNLKISNDQVTQNTYK